MWHEFKFSIETANPSHESASVKDFSTVCADISFSYKNSEVHFKAQWWSNSWIKFMAFH